MNMGFLAVIRTPILPKEQVIGTSSPGNGSTVVRIIRSAVLFPVDPVGGIGGVRAADLALFLVAVLGVSRMQG
jgi:hypothetical protein